MAVQSQIFCKLCNETIVSRHRHDWVACKGGHVFIDGGSSYLHYGILKEGVTDKDFDIVAGAE